VIILYLEHQVLVNKSVLQVFMGETLDIICDVKSYGEWKFKKGDLPNNTMFGYSRRGMFLRILKITPGNIGHSKC